MKVEKERKGKMLGSDFMDEIDCGNFFDQMGDIIDFPADNRCGFGSGGCNDFPGIWSNPSDLLLDSGQILSGDDSNEAPDPSSRLAFPCEDIDIVNLNWLSDFVDDSLLGGGRIMTLEKQNASDNEKWSQHNQFQTLSPISVLENSNNSNNNNNNNNNNNDNFFSSGKIMPLDSIQLGPQRARSKRPRPSTFNPRPSIQLVSPTSSITENPSSFPPSVASSESDNFANSPPKRNIPKLAADEHKKKRKKMKLPISLAPVEMNRNLAPVVRKCTHCEITKTPQWRLGPTGPKTLCNACGVRFKSGRLFPEYRPAASPTFVPALHSNSHKKVLEMRIHGGDQKCSTVVSATTTPTTT